MSPSRGLLYLALLVSLGVSARAQEPPGEEGGPLAPKTAPVGDGIIPRDGPGAKTTPKGVADVNPLQIAPLRDGPATIGPADTTALPASPILPAPHGTPAERDKWLSAKVDEILGRPSLAGVHAGVMVAEIDSGRTLYARNERALYNPASNAKLITTAAALGLLGPEFRFKTALYGVVKAGEVQGDLYLRGTGDPSLVPEDLWKMVADLAGAGVRRVSGAIAIDDTYFDDVRIGPAFDQKNEDYAFRAPNGAVSFNYNACAVRVMAGSKEGAPPRVVVEPQSPYFTIVNQARTIARGKSELTIKTAEIEGHTEVTVAGTIKKGSGEQMEHRRIAHPDLYTAYSLRELLLKRGIKVVGTVASGAVPPGARLLVSHASPPLGVIVRDVNKLSNNFMAEQLLKTMGAEIVGKPGTWPKGVQAVGKFLDGIGVYASNYKMTNGSGLYDADRFTPQQIVELLRHAYRDFRFAADFVGSLAVAGADGTIGHRMEGSPAERFVRAKTGTLNGVSCLSGYAGAPGKMPLAFSVLMNGVGDTATGDARRAQDAIAEALVLYLEAK